MSDHPLPPSSGGPPDISPGGGTAVAPPASPVLPRDLKIVSEPRRKVVVRTTETLEEAMRSVHGDGRTRQYPLLVMAEILPGHEDALKEVLAYIGDNDVEDNDLLPFARLKTVHFARFVVHEASPSDAAPIPTWRGVPQAHGPAIPAKLLFSTDHDGPREAHLEELVREVKPGLDAVFQHCAGYPAEGRRTPEAVIAWMKRHYRKTDTFYTGTMNRSVQQIRREARLHDAIEGFLDGRGLSIATGNEALAVRAEIQKWVEGRPEFEWTRIPSGDYPTPAISPETLAALQKNLLPVGLAIGVVVAAAVALVLWLTGQTPAMAALYAVLGVLAVAAAGYGAFRLLWNKLRKLEQTDPVIINEEWQDITRALVRTEDRIVQNEMSSVIYVKEPLRFRGLVLGAVLAFVNFSARFISNTGNLVGIPSIHFARWVKVDDGRRLVFFSNFDGSWQNYLGDFIDKSADGLTGVWSNCVGFPRTVGLFGQGARNEQKFKQYSRQSQIPTQVWYSAYKWLSVDNINNNTKIRLGLQGGMSPEEAQAWLRRF